MLNKAIIIGNVGHDPDVRYSQTQAPIANFRVATNESYTDRDGNRQERTEWHQIVAYNRTAETCARYLRKGRLVYVEGKIQTRKWQDKQGQDRYTTEIVAQTVKFLDRRGENVGAEDDGGRQTGFRGAPAGGNRDAGFSPRPRDAGRGEPDPYDFDSGGSGMDEVPFG